MATYMHTWLKSVIQATKPWMSSKDIDRGSIWFSEISNQLADVGVGIVFLTQENKEKPWILFEAGALAKGLSTNRVCTFLIDIKPTEIQAPLSHFNHTICNKESVRELVRTINSVGGGILDDVVLSAVFETYWPQLEEFYEMVTAEKEPRPLKSAPRTQEDILGEILENSRRTEIRINKLEALIERPQSPRHNGALNGRQVGVALTNAIRSFDPSGPNLNAVQVAARSGFFQQDPVPFPSIDEPSITSALQLKRNSKSSE